MDNRQSCLCPFLGHGLGSGKSVTTLTAIERLLYDELEEGPVLVIAPLRVAQNTWTTECSKWDHLNHLKVSKVLGSAAEREKALGVGADIYVINRENVVWLVEHCAKKHHWPFKIVVIDELSSFKSPSAKRFKALRTVRGRCERVIGLTGTPRPNGIEDLWPEIYLLDQGVRLGRTITSFRQQYLRPEKMNGHVVYSYKPLPGAEEAVTNKISDICMSVKKEEVLDLPGQQFIDFVIDLDPKVMKTYRQFEKDSVLACLDENGEIVAGSAATLTGKLLQFCGGAVYDENRGVHVFHDAKIEALEELIEQAGGESVLVFYNYKHELERIQQRIPCRKLETEQDIADWNAGKIGVGIAHPASVSHGLNLQAGGHIIVWYGLNYSLELTEQANERLNRPGQTHECLVYRIIARGTYDERVLSALERKEVNQSALLNALKIDIMSADK